jgi:hypothetical protein
MARTTAAQLTVPSALIDCNSSPAPGHVVGRTMVAKFPVSSKLCATLAVESKYIAVLPGDGIDGAVPACPVSTNVPVLLVVSAFCQPLVAQNQVSPLTVSSYSDPALQEPDGAPAPVEADAPVSKAQVLVATHAYKFLPGTAVVRK